MLLLVYFSRRFRRVITAKNFHAATAYDDIAEDYADDADYRPDALARGGEEDE